ncbi:MAG: hypothetical protein ABI791_04375 [Acidobacteriota bacterium]
MMDLKVEEQAEDTFAFSSSVADDVWHSGKQAGAYESWYFDALSDDGRDAVTIRFLDDFVYSTHRSVPPPNGSIIDSEAPDSVRCPAVSLTYFRDGKLLFRTKLEFPEDAFDASETEPSVKIDQNFISYRSASYGTGYHLQIDAATSARGRIRANFEWLVIESDLCSERPFRAAASHRWNMVAPRCDVTGKVAVSDRKGRSGEVVQFRGTGYHDHKLDNGWLAEMVHEWHWGRAHFADSTAVYCRYRTNEDDRSSTKLFVVRSSELVQYEAEFEEQNFVRSKFGLKYPRRLRLFADEGMQLSVKPIKTIDTGFYGMKFLSEMKLTLGDGGEHETTGITEYLMPGAWKHRLLTWLPEIGTRKNRGGRIF